MAQEERVRLNLVMPAGTREFIDKLSRRIESATMSETIRRALNLLDVITEQQESGSVLFFHHKNGEQTEFRML